MSKGGEKELPERIHLMASTEWTKRLDNYWRRAGLSGRSDAIRLLVERQLDAEEAAEVRAGKRRKD